VTGDSGYSAIGLVTIRIKDRATERKALAFLLGRFSDRVMKNGDHVVPEAALEALAQHDIPFIVNARPTCDEQRQS
jgi:hypothetical protein